MNVEQFWTIVERVHVASPDDMNMKCNLLATELQQLPLDELKSFDDHFGDCFSRAYTWDVWGAAFVICDGCGDDGFMDFRSTLISLGRKPFATALVDADALAQFYINPAWARYEGYQYVSGKVRKELGEKEPECDCAQCKPDREKINPTEPAGTPFIEWEMSVRFPRLVAKYGYKDSSWVYLKVQKDKMDAKSKASWKTAELLLQAGIIPSCGLIPPFRIVVKVMESGQAPRSAGSNLNWEPYGLDEDVYWSTVMILEKMAPDEKIARPELASTELRLDLKCPDIDDFDGWVESLKERGLA